MKNNTRSILRKATIESCKLMGCSCKPPEVVLKFEMMDPTLERAEGALRLLHDLAKEHGFTVIAIHTPTEEQGVRITVHHDDGCPALALWDDRGPQVLVTKGTPA